MTRFLFVTVATLLIISSLSACGRRAALEAPSAAATPSAPNETPVVADKPFVLDGLIK
jgi:predicted small lipoprotein YifL